MKGYSTLLALGLLLSCQKIDKEVKSAEDQLPVHAVAILAPIGDYRAIGVVTFTTTDSGVWVVADVNGLPEGKHGLHIHEFGVCHGPDALSAGGHFNPSNQPHGGPDSDAHHAGDLGNLVADSFGHAHMERLDKDLALSGPDSIIGRSVVVHEKEDDFKTQPSGDSGARISCGVIEPGR